MDTLTKMFTQSFYIVPDYQRGYSWEITQLDDFWKDLTWLQPNSTHYTGTFTFFPLSPTPAKFPSNIMRTVYHIVDGQQRLTTSFLLLSKLISRGRSTGTIAGQPVNIVENNFVFDLTNGQRISLLGYDSPVKSKFLEDMINEWMDPTVIPPGNPVVPNNVYERNLVTASKYFDKKIQSFSSAQIDNLFLKLTKQLVFDIHIVDNTFDVCARFESINYRGKELTKFEVLKNRLMYLTEQLSSLNPTVKSAAEKLRIDIDSAWASAFDCFGVGELPLSEDDFLSQHTIMYFGSLDNEKNSLEKKLFQKIFLQL